MSGTITFNFDVRKFVHAAAWLVERRPETTRMKLAKLLRFADRDHLLVCGRPVPGDRYIRMEFGPVPSQACNIMKHDERVAAQDQALFDHYLDVRGNHIIFRMPANPDCLSETDFEILEGVLTKYGPVTPAHLSRLSHCEPAWQSAALNSTIDLSLLLQTTTQSGNWSGKIRSCAVR